MTVTKGTLIQSNEDGKAATVIDVIGNYALYFTGKRNQKIRLDRIHLDGRARKSGWNVVTEVTSPVPDLREAGANE